MRSSGRSSGVTDSSDSTRAARRQDAPAAEADQRGATQCEMRCIHPQAVAEARAQLRAVDTYQAIADLFAVLADPTRAQVVHLLLQRELCSCDLAAALGMSAPRISQHLRVLRAAHVVQTRREGKFVIYSLDDAHMRMLFQIGLAHTGETEADAALVDIG